MYAQKFTPAGAVPRGNNESSIMCLRPDLHGPPRETTPEHIRKYRQSYKQQPGAILVHPGLQKDLENIDRNKAQGKMGAASEDLAAVIRAQNLTGLADKFNDIKEKHYASVKKEPLGKTQSRDYIWPSGVKEQFAFGVGSNKCDSAKDLIFPASGAKTEDPAIASMYAKTHGNVAAGVQRNREYVWNGIDPQTHAFGYREQAELNQAAKAVHSERVEQGFPKTVIVKKTVEDTQIVQADALGTSKNTGQGLSDQARNMVFGAPSLKDHHQWNAAQCLRGEPTAKELMPDSDLGKCTKPGSRNQVRREQDSARAFGCPSIRTDIPNKSFKSVANFQNYGDEPDVIDVLFPQTALESGVTEQDFLKLRGKVELRQLFENLGFPMRPAKFNAIFNRSVQISQQLLPRQQFTEGFSTARGMMKALNEMKDI